MVGNPLAASPERSRFSTGSDASDLAGARDGKGTRATGITVRDGVACVTKDFGSGADCTQSGDGLARVPDRHPLRRCRDGHRYRHRARQPRRRRARRGGRRVSLAASMSSAPSNSSRRAIPTAWRKRTRTPPRRTRAGFPPSAHRRARRSAPISAPTAQTRPPASSSASACGPPPRPLESSPNRSTRPAMGERALAGRQSDCPGPTAPDPRGSHGEGAHDRGHNRRNGARVQSLGVVAGFLPARR